MIRHEIFPVPVWQFTFDKANEFKEKIVPMFKEIEKKNPNNNIKYTKEGYTSYGPINNILDYDECLELKNFVMESVVEAIKDFSCLLRSSKDLPVPIIESLKSSNIS